MTEERKQPKKDDPFKNQPPPKIPVPANAAVPGVQPKNTPDGRDAPPSGERR
jgi:hypothetical protein